MTTDTATRGAREPHGPGGARADEGGPPAPDAPPPARPRWERPAYWVLLAATAVLFLYGLGASGYANSFYSAAAQAGSQSWKAFLFGSLDSANAITVDKPPAALWPMALSARLFGLGHWQILVPQALMGVGTVAVLYAAVRRRVGPAGGLLAGALLAVTPVAALMFRFNNPDALLSLLMVSALYFLLRALEDARTKWLLLCGLCLGAGFLVKTLQAWLVLPVLAVVYLVCAPARWPRRIGQLLLGGLAMVASCGWWVALVELWPAGSRPYVGGSQSNSFLELTFGYNGFGRITGNETGSVGGGAPGGGHGGHGGHAAHGGGPGGGGPGGGWGQTGVGRLFGDQMGAQISWLLPAALILLAAGLVLTRRYARTDALRAAFLTWGGALLVTGATFSFMSGIVHEYYNIALAPYLAAVVAMGAVLLWRRRAHPAASATLALAVAASAAWSYVLLGRAADWQPWLRWAVAGVGLVAAAALLAPGRWRLPRRAGGAVAALGLAAATAGPVAYTLETVATAHQGAIVTAGPASARGGPGGPGGMHGPPGGGAMKGRASGAAKGGLPGAAKGHLPGAAGHGRPGAGKGGSPMPGGMPGHGGHGGKGTGGKGGMGGPGGMGGLLNGRQVGGAVKATVLKGAKGHTWAAAAIGSQNAASYQLATQRPVMAVGGFNGSDPSPTLAQFEKDVHDGRIHYFVGGSQGGPGGGQGSSASIASWVKNHFEKKKVGGATLYDLTKEKSPSPSGGSAEGASEKG